MANIAHTRGIFFGGIILSSFGGFWSILALSFRSSHPRWAIALAIAITLVLLLLCVRQLWATRKIRSIDDPVAAAKGKRDGIWFGIIFGIEGTLIGVSCAILGSRGLDHWIPIAIAIIVGLHFLPLARLFNVPVYYWTGAVSTLGVLGCLLLGDFAVRDFCVGMLMAAVLWLTVAYLLARTRIAG